MFAEFLSWWGAELAGLLGPLRGTARLPDAVLLRAARDGALTVLRRRRGQERVVATVAPGQPPSALRAAVAGRGRRERLVLAHQGRLLLREVAVPLSAERNLDAMLTYEIDRLTPFSAPDVVWSRRVIGRDAARGLRVELAVAPRAAVAPLLAHLDEAGARPVALEATGPDGVVRVLPLTPPDPARIAARRRREAVAAGLCAVLAVALVGVPFVRQSLVLARIEARIDALRPAVAHAEALRHRIIDGGAGAGRLAAARAEAGTALRALGALTDLLPDDTWLTSLSLRKAQISIEGQSAQATRLIGMLASDPRLRNPSFIAPVVRDQTGSDIFSIRAEFAP